MGCQGKFWRARKRCSPVDRICSGTGKRSDKRRLPISSPVSESSPGCCYAATAPHVIKLIWKPGAIDYYLDGALVAIHTQDLPSTAAYFIFNFWGTDSTTWGGLATPAPVPKIRAISLTEKLVVKSRLALGAESRHHKFHARRSL